MSLDNNNLDFVLEKAEVNTLLKLARNGFTVEEAKEKLSHFSGLEHLLEQVDTYQKFCPNTDFADVLVNFLVSLPAKTQAMAVS